MSDEASWAETPDPNKPPRLTVDELVILEQSGYIGRVEMRNVLSKIYPEFANSRDPSIDDQYRNLALYKADEFELSRLQLQQELEEARRIREEERAGRPTG